MTTERPADENGRYRDRDCVASDPSLQPWREALDAQADALGLATRARLAAARRAAVAAARHEVPRGRVHRWRMAAWPVLAAAALVAVAVGLRDPAPSLPAPATDAADFAHGLVVATGEDAAALEEDLEFYAWLDAQSQDG